MVVDRIGICNVNLEGAIFNIKMVLFSSLMGYEFTYSAIEEWKYKKIYNIELFSNN